MYSDIVPEDLQNELIALRDNDKATRFRLGDITRQILNEKPMIPAGQIYRAVGMFAGFSARTIREYAAVSALIDYGTRIEYDILSFDHFRTALRLGDQWQEALCWAVETVDEINRPATVDAMLQKFREQTTENIDKLAPDDIPLQLQDRLRQLAEFVYLHEGQLPPAVVEKLTGMILETQTLLQTAAVVV